MKKEYFLKGLAVVIALFGFVLGMISNNAVAGLFPASMLLVSALVSTVVHISICLLFFYLLIVFLFAYCFSILLVGWKKRQFVIME